MTKNPSKKNDDSDSIAEHNRLKIMLELFEADLTYTQLAEKTKLANNTLIKRLSDLQTSGIIKGHLRRSTATSKPVIVYAIGERWKSKLEKLKATLDISRTIESKCMTYITSYKQRLDEAKDTSAKEKVTDKATTVIMNSMMAILIQGMLYEAENLTWKSFVSSQTLSMAGHVVWGHNMIPEFEMLSREALRRGIQVAMQRIEKETMNLKDC